MTIDLGELVQYVFLPRYSPDLAPLDFLCFLPYGKTTEEAFCISKAAPSDFSCRVLLSEYGGSARNDWYVSNKPNLLQRRII
jgi:hypothetical protein